MAVVLNAEAAEEEVAEDHPVAAVSLREDSAEEVVVQQVASSVLLVALNPHVLREIVAIRKAASARKAATVADATVAEDVAEIVEKAAVDKRRHQLHLRLQQPKKVTFF